MPQRSTWTRPDWLTKKQHSSFNTAHIPPWLAVSKPKALLFCKTSPASEFIYSCKVLIWAVRLTTCWVSSRESCQAVKTEFRSPAGEKKNLQIINVGKGVEKREYSFTVGGNANWYSHYGRWYGDSLKTRNKTTIWPSNPTPKHPTPRLWGNQNWKRHIYPIVHWSTVYNS